jgi:hypothetical protein
VSHALRARSVGLVDVHSLHWAPDSYFLLFILRLGAGIGGFTTDGVVEDVDFGGAGTAEIYQFTFAFLPELVTQWNGVGSRSLQYVFDFGIINTLDVFIVREILFFTLMFEDLEPGCVECVFVLGTTDVVDCGFQWYGGSVVGLWPSDIRWMGRTSIFVVFVVVEDGRYITRLI